MGKEMRRGEVRWYDFGRPDKRRPVLVLTRNSALEFLTETTVAPVTRTIRDIPTEVLLTTEDGMPEDCAVSLDHLQTVNSHKLGAIITTVREDSMKRIRRALLFALGF